MIRHSIASAREAAGPIAPLNSGRRRVPAIVLAAMLAVAPALAQDSARSRGFYANVVITTQDDLSLEFLNEAVSSEDDCKAAAALIANTVRASCTTCSVVKLQCSSALEPRHERLLSQEPVDVPSSRLPRGVVAYLSGNPQLALASCREAELRASTGQGYSATCYPPQSRRPSYSAFAPESPSTLRIAALGALVLILTALASGFAGFLIVRYERVHGHWSADPVNVGPQKFHATPTPRIGGLGVMAGLLLAAGTLRVVEPGSPSELFGYLLFASLPAFLGGITEDATKSTSVPARLALTMVAAAVGVWLMGAVIPRLDVPGFDALLRWTPFAIAFTVFAVGGVANSINIIDGYNGLAAGHAVVVLAAFAWISSLVGDEFLFLSALAMSGALIGFLVWNYPGGKIFLGDGGAYLLGFWLGELSVLLVVRHPQVSPWFPMLLLVYPIFETLFSMFRRKIIQGLSPGQPDRMHLHQMVYNRIAQVRTDLRDPASATRLNSMVAPYAWVATVCCAVPALFLWRNTAWLVTVSIGYSAGYVAVYSWLSPRVRRNHL